MPSTLPFRQVHLDFHTSEHIGAVGQDFSKEDFQSALRLGRVDSVTLFAKCHHGWSYYPTTIGVPHPGLARPDLLGEQLAAAREMGVAAPVYLTVQWDEVTAREHPEWRVMKADGGSGQEQLQAVWHPLCLSNAPLVDRIATQAEELISLYHPIGLFFDILLPWECVCPNCLDRMQKAGRNPDEREARLANHRDIILEYYERVSSAVRRADSACRIFHNSGHIAKGERERWRWFSHLELESLPTGGWGWDHFPLSARYANTLGLPFLGMTGKFHTTWGEFGGYKSSVCLEYECASMVAQGARCSVGDQLHPSGLMDRATYERLGAAYRRVESLEPYAEGAVPVSEIAILSVEAAGAYRRANGEKGASAVSPHSGLDADAGAVRVLLEGHVMFDVIDGEEDFSRYALLVLPDEVLLDSALAEKLRAYVAAGGSLILSGSSGMDAGERSFLLDVGADYAGGTSPWNPDYLRVRNLERYTGSKAGARMVDSPFVVYERARMVQAREAEVFADVHTPYFNRDWNHFCSHQHAPFRKEPSAEYHGAIRYGRILYYSHPLFTAYKRSGQPLLRDLLLLGLESLLPGKLPDLAIPSGARMTLMRQEAERRTILHLLYAPPSLRGSSHPFEGCAGQVVEIVEDTVPLRDIPCRIPLPKKPSRVRTVMGEKDLPFNWNSGSVEFIVSYMYIHEAVVFDD